MNTEQSNIIQAEMQELSPTIAQMGRVNPFRVPEGFFASTGEGLAFGLSEEEDMNLSPQLAAFKGVNPFSLPEGYFSSMQVSLKEGLLAQAGDQALGQALSSLKGKNPFKVPVDYFQELTISVLGATDLKKLSKGSSFKVPEAYFENLPDRVLQNVKEGEVQSNGEAAPKVIEMQPAAGNSSGGGLRRILTGLTAIAAVLAILFVGNNLMNSVSPSDGPLASNDPDTDIMTSISKLSDDEILQFLEDSDFDLGAASLDGMILLDDFSGVSDFGDDVLQEYLLQELNLTNVKDLYL